MSTGNVVFITGATGVNAAAVNGPFDRTNEKCGSYLLYNRRGDASTCVEHFQGKWQVKAVSTKGKDSCLAYIASNSDLESCISLRWSIHDGKVWSEAPAIKMTMGAEARRQADEHSAAEVKAVGSDNAQAVPMVISGATGTYAVSINGVFDPTQEKGLDGRVLYAKRGDASTCIEHFGGKWQVKAVSHKSTNVCYAYVAAGCGLHACTGRQWIVGDGKAWVNSPDVEMAAHTLASSKFKRAYEVAECPDQQYEFFASVHNFLKLLCTQHTLPPSAATDLFDRLQTEAFEHPGELLSEIQVAATRIWTSTQKLQGAGVGRAFNVEFCSLLNRALREDAAEVMPHLAVIVRAINALCIVRRESSSLKFPPNAVSHRGGALPKEHHSFFTVGHKYRVPMYLATSFSEEKAYEFWYRQFAVGQVPVHWVIHFDKRGEQTLRYRCKNVNLVEKTVKGVEDELEFLFVPYSVFSVKSVHIPSKITGDDPVTIHLEAAIDNANEDETLPLAPWH